MSIAQFTDFKLNKQLFNALTDAGYTEPTDIQVRAIPLALAGHDLLGIAQTGTGKTAAFVLPILMKVKYAQGDHARALILAPTRELVLQIEEHCLLLGKYTDLRIVALYGGVGPKTQIELLEKGSDIIVATPGRLLDLYLKGQCVLKFIKTLVLDEADRMLDMGFMPQIRKVLEVVPVKRQNMLFSATMPGKVITLSHEFLEFPEKVEVTPSATAVETVTQELYYIPNLRTKINFLVHLFTQYAESFHRVIIFVKNKTTADNIYKYLNRKDFGEIRVIHANKGQNTRINAMNSFKEGSVRVLVTTDVSSRGIDVENVSHVINFDVPMVYEDYVHRIGRTGRARRVGKALTFCTAADAYHVEKIEKLIREKIPVKPLPAEVAIVETPLAELQETARSIDLQKRRENPDFKGAFHEKKWKKDEKGKTGKKGKGDKVKSPPRSGRKRS